MLFSLFAVTGFSALTLQVVWQRVISMHAGVDLFSITTVVSAFLAGLGIGSLLGGWLADRLGPRRSLLAFACSNAAIAVYAWFSIWLFYDVYRSVVTAVDGTFRSFLFHFALLVVPTTLMGLSLPLVSRGIVDTIGDAAPAVGRLYAINTLGAGVGAAVSGWLLLGNLGFVGAVRFAAALNLFAAVLVFTLWRLAGRAAAAPAGPAAEPEPSDSSDRRTWPWFVIYGLTGAVALGLEVIFFRVTDGLMRSNSYTFGHVLAIYLLLFGAGAAVASRLCRRSDRPERWFLGLQFGVGLAALAGLMILIYVPSLLGVDAPLRRHFAIDGYNLGEYAFSPPSELARLVFVHLIGPLLVMGLPVVLMGASFPFAQALVARRMDTLGRQTGRLLFANIAGNVAGTLLVGFVLIDWLGTAGTLRLLAGLLLVPGLVAAALVHRRERRTVAAVGAVVVMGAALAVFPTNHSLWEYFHSAQDHRFALAEDRACVNALRGDEKEELLFINAASQNPYPYDDFHVLIGLLPSLMHPEPERLLAVGLGIGATPYGMSLDHRFSTLDVVELCGGEIDLLEGLARQGSPENQRFLSDERVELHVGDGRKHLLAADGRFDVLTVDVIRPQSAFSGGLYSVEFYELVRSRLATGGLFSQWIPSNRTRNGVTHVFPHVMMFSVASYGGSQFMVASRHPITFDRQQVLARFDTLVANADGGFLLAPERLRTIRDFLTTVEPALLRDGTHPAPVDESHLNRDLFPRDEYFLNNPFDVPVRAAPPGR
ncbi:MAG: fused MFS/spermidine synthase [Acidimicrobiales bacterium]